MRITAESARDAATMALMALTITGVLPTALAYALMMIAGLSW